MLFLSFFNELTSFLFGISALAFLGFATFFTPKSKISTGLKEFFFGLLIYFMTAGFVSQYAFFISTGVSIEVLTTLKLLMMVCVTILFLMASSEILLQQKLSLTIIFVFISCGVLLSLYTVFIAKSEQMYINVGTVLPLIGFLYLFLSFISQTNLKKHTGHILAALAVFGFIEQIGLYLFLGIPTNFIFTLGLILILSASYFMIAMHFLNEEKALTEENLIKTQQDIEDIIQLSPFPILISKLTDDSIVFANHNALKLFELNLAELSRYHFKDLFVDADNRKLLFEKLEHFAKVQDFEILVKTAIGETPFWLMVSANTISYQGSMALYCAFQDITARKLRENALLNQVNHDPLTAIYNRRYFEKNVKTKIDQAHKFSQNFAILMIDADYFKNINDQFGHKTGDKVLIELAHTLERSLRPDDIVARYGGEEFVVFLNNVTADIAQMVALRLKDAVSSAVVYSENGTPVTWTVSIGVAPSGISDDVGVMIKMADDAMYYAKEQGRNRVELYKPQIAQGLASKQPQKEQVHPVFAREEEEEISLLDGIETSHMEE